VQKAANVSFSGGSRQIIFFRRLSPKSFGGLRRRIFFRAPILLLLLCKINKIGALKNFILPPKAAEYL
jgi:hypothetical protein